MGSLGPTSCFFLQELSDVSHAAGIPIFLGAAGAAATGLGSFLDKVRIKSRDVWSDHWYAGASFYWSPRAHWWLEISQDGNIDTRENGNSTNEDLLLFPGELLVKLTNVLPNQTP